MFIGMASIKHFLMIFVDGLGWGSSDPGRNPLAAMNSRLFPVGLPGVGGVGIPYAGLAVAADACLGVSGLPQSATGQTSLLTGVNASAMLGYHLGGYPTKPLKLLIEQKSIFIRLSKKSYSCAFANAYQPSFFNSPPLRVSVTTAACQLAGVRLRNLEDLRRGQSVYQDFTHRLLRERGVDIPEESPRQAGIQLAQISRMQDFTLYEHFQTDLAGHSGDMRRAIRVATELEQFLVAILEQFDLHSESLLLASDHGNLEDMSSPIHTFNPVYVICWGPIKEYISSSIHAITDVVPAIMQYLRDPVNKTENEQMRREIDVVIGGYHGDRSTYGTDYLPVRD